jgi:hypothetical protein
MNTTVAPFQLPAEASLYKTMISVDGIIALVCTFSVASCFIVAVVGQQFVADVAVSRYPHTDVAFRFFNRFVFTHNKNLMHLPAGNAMRK